MTHTVFFAPAPAKIPSHQVMACNFINIGGEQFHALAVGLIDNLKNATRINESLIKKVSEQFFLYYPKLRPKQAYLTPFERMNILFTNGRKSEVVECMAYVLRQIAVNEIYAHPLNYKEVFDELDEQTPKAFLRKSSTPLPVCALIACTRALGINIILSFVEPEKNLRKRGVDTSVSKNMFNTDLIIQIQGDQYFPGVKNRADFAYVGQLAIFPIKPIELINEQSDTIADMIALIKMDNQRLLHSYQQWRQNLLTMVDSNELNTKQLLDLYIEFLPKADSAISNTNEFFAKLNQVSKNPISTEPFKNSTNQMNELLASALAGWISTSQVEVDQLLERADTKSQKGSTLLN